MAKNEKEPEDSGVTEGGRPERHAGQNHRGSRPDPEVAAKATRRRFRASYKPEILREADRCTKPGELGALLRREGILIQSEHLATSTGAWRSLSMKVRHTRVRV